MTDVDRVLRPLREQGAALEKLDTYASAAELADAIASVHAALDRSVRLLLRTDGSAPEPARMAALAGDTPLDTVITALRRDDRVTMELAGRLHEADTVARRIAGGKEARATDADAVQAALQLYQDEVRRAGPAVPAAPVAAPPRFTLEEDAAAAEPEERSSRPLVLLAIAVVVVVAVVALLQWRAGGAGGERAAAIAAFQAGDLAVARSGLETVVAEDPADVTALLYLARIHRREGREREAAAALERAVTRAPQDADVRRELGWLFLDLGRPEAAVEQFRMARDAEPAVASNWIGLVRALREANDPSAAEVLRQAPPEAQAVLGTAAR